ncbi:Ger(x)C family spore germination C-terminal domain-containing protein [Bacillus sp. FJAT-25509]|uniref:Ger(x)C family spore germination C-terminal domain-containing protein n=1 Tax=Bacillus sp. FJAT-25509 TaxID=1712029 RepID=UPI00155EF222|nr:Ger(x)C family spore germination C-terminal domain-containing protein [Bacillus sp. FJAT-25509]
MNPDILNYPVAPNEKGKTAIELLTYAIGPLIEFIQQDSIRNWGIVIDKFDQYSMVLTFDEESNRSPYVITEILNDYYMRLKETGINPYLPIIEPFDSSFKINTAVVFKGKKFKAVLNRDETRLLNELLNPEKTTLINVGKGKNQFYVSAGNMKTDMKIVMRKNKKPYVDVHIKVKGFIEESQKSIHQNRELKEYEKTASKFMNSRTKKFLERLQELNVDPLGLGLNFQAKYGMTEKEINKWEEIYPKIEFRVKSEVKLKGTGTMYLNNYKILFFLINTTVKALF